MSFPFSNKNVKQVFNSYPEEVRRKLFEIRDIIFSTALKMNIGEVEETLKWGEPSYILKESNDGSTIRIAWKKKNKNQFGFYVNCKTSLISMYKEIFGDQLNYEGNRALIFKTSEKLPKRKLKKCIAIAFNYKNIKKEMGY